MQSLRAGGCVFHVKTEALQEGRVEGERGAGNQAWDTVRGCYGWGWGWFRACGQAFGHSNFGGRRPRRMRARRGR